MQIYTYITKKYQKKSLNTANGQKPINLILILLFFNSALKTINDNG